MSKGLAKHGESVAKGGRESDQGNPSDAAYRRRGDAGSPSLLQHQAGISTALYDTSRIGSWLLPDAVVQRVEIWPCI